MSQALFMIKLAALYLRTTAIVGALAIVPFVAGVESGCAKNLFDIFKRKDTQAVEESQNQVLKSPKNTATQISIKRVSNPPKSYDYKPERLFDFDFSKIDFQKTASTISNHNQNNSAIVQASNAHFDNSMTQENTVSQFLLNVRLIAEKNIGDVVINYYAHNPNFIWSKQGNLTPQAQSLLEQFSKANEDGLDPLDYAVPLPKNNLSAEEQGNAWAQFDVLMSARILRYVQDAAHGRIVADRLSPYYDLPRDKLNLDEIFTQLVQSKTPTDIAVSYFPKSQKYQILKRALASMNEQADVTTALIPTDIIIRPGQTNENLPNFIKLLLSKAPSIYLDKYRSVLVAHQDNDIYDQELKIAIQAFQKQAGKSADGVIGPSTLAVIQGQTQQTKKQNIIDSMERLRWLPRNFGDRYVFINQPSFRAQYYANGQEQLNMKVVIGSPSHQTYFFHDKIKLVTFNPSWGVPRSIIMNEMLPRILNDPSYLSRNGYEVYSNSGKVVSASTVNWQQVATTGNGVGVRQLPGKNNALGELKILFPNKHDIYLHDTPNKAAFSRDMRALSHGCVRLENPRAMAAAVLGKNINELKPYFGKNERNVQLTEQVPVYLVYFTAWPNEKTGEIDYFSDVYSRDSSLQNAVKKTNISRQTI